MPLRLEEKLTWSGTKPKKNIQSVARTKRYELLINEAKKLDIKKLSLETGAGKFFNPARKLFDQCGFKECDPFSHYKEDDNSEELNLGPISVTTGNVNVSDFYFDLVSGEETESSGSWSILVKTEGDYNMPSIFLNEDLDVAVYDNLLFADLTELPGTFADHQETDHSVFRYQGSYEILNRNRKNT